MKIRFIFFCCLLMISNCSSKPDKVYQINQFKHTSLDLMRLGDRQRQMEAYQEALALYLKSEQYALKRNDQQQIGLSKLKRALIYLILENITAAENLIKQVNKANRLEGLSLDPSIKFLNSKLLIHQGNKKKALSLLLEVETYYQNNFEKNTYYKLLRWSIDYQQLSHDEVLSMIEKLTSKFKAKQLQNIEILSFAYFEHARWAVDNTDLEQGKLIIERATQHFSALELTPKIAKTLNLAALFYLKHGQIKEYDYYKSAAEIILN